MLNIIETIVAGRWFAEPSPFRCRVEPGHEKLCLITGPNVCGKSFLRKVLHTHHKKQGLNYIHISQEGRGSGGIVKAMVYGSEEDDSTGYNSVRMLLKAIQSGQGYDEPFGMMLDEPEIGCSEEVQVAMARRVVEQLDSMPKLDGFFVITHSRHVARELLVAKPTHWRLSDDGMTHQQYVDREVVPADLDQMLELGHERWRAVNDMLNKKKA